MSHSFSLSNEDPLDAVPESGKFVVGQLGQSLDGFIASRTGHSKYINDPSGLTHLHRLRAAVDGVLVGVGTVNDDDPLLTVRNCEGKNPVRIIVDPNGRVFKQSKLFSDGAGDVFILTKRETTHPMEGLAKILPLDAQNGRLQPHDILKALEAEGLSRILVEGGSKTLSAFIDAGAIDRLHLIVAPVLMGGGYNGLNLKAIDQVSNALRPKVTVHHLGHDMLFDCDFTADID